MLDAGADGHVDALRALAGHILGAGHRGTAAAGECHPQGRRPTGPEGRAHAVVADAGVEVPGSQASCVSEHVSSWSVWRKRTSPTVIERVPSRCTTVASVVAGPSLRVIW
jgi:hypothetical protein